MRMLISALILALTLFVAPAMAQSDAEVDAAIDNVLGDHGLYRAAFDAIQAAVGEGDATALAAWVGYPIKVMADGAEVTLETEAAFIEHYDAILTDEIRSAILDQTWQDLFVNAEGVMFGDGQVWLSGICTDEACAAFDVKVITIQSTSN